MLQIESNAVGVIPL